jgi:Cu(I)/Ag(I) efflux system membrane fusion protein/cobalt-zinc-cadmium efflux system membrane fusion protein
VLRTGTRNIAFIDRGDGYLTPADLELGPRVGDDLVVLKGLEPGERIVASANFLIDSESQLQAAAGSFVPPPPGVTVNEARPLETAHKASIVLEVATIPSPPVRGKNQVRVTLTDSHGRAIDDARVTVSFFMAAMPAMGMTAMRESVSPAAQGGGLYRGDLDLESRGTWQVTAVAARDGKTLASRQFNVSVSGGM